MIRRPTLAAATAAAALAWAIGPRIARADEVGCKEGGLAPEIRGDCVKKPAPGTALAPDIDVLKAPESPAFVAVGLAPTEIQRPTTPLGATLALATGIARGAIVPGRDLALEVTPYWLAAHPHLNYAELLEDRAWSWLRTLSFSFAATDAPAPQTTGMTTTAASARSLSTGLHATLWPGDPSPAARACLARMLEYTRADSAVRARAKQGYLQQWDALNPAPAEPDPDAFPSEAAFEHAVEVWMGADDLHTRRRDREARAFDEQGHEALPPPSTEVQDCLTTVHHRVGPMLDAAGAVVVTVPGGWIASWDQAGASRRYLTWLTGAWTWMPGDVLAGDPRAIDLSLLSALRLQKEVAAMAPDPGWSWDLGLRGILAVGRWGFSLETLRRGGTGDGPTPASRWASSVLVDFRLQSAMWLTATAGYGWNQLDDGFDWRNVRALLNLQVGLSRDRKLQPDASPLATASGGAP